MLVIVAVEAEKFPVAAVGRVVVVVVVFMMHRQFPEFFTFELPGTATADVREEFQCFLPVAGLVLLLFFAHLCDELVALFGFRHDLSLSVRNFDKVCRF